MGLDFHYESASQWLGNLDKLMHYANALAGDQVNVFYSTPTAYADAKHAEGTQAPRRGSPGPHAASLRPGSPMSMIPHPRAPMATSGAWDCRGVPFLLQSHTSPHTNIPVKQSPKTDECLFAMRG